MKHPVLALLGLLAVAAAPIAQAVEILRWERMPLAVPLKVGQERIVFIDHQQLIHHKPLFLKRFSQLPHIYIHIYIRNGARSYRNTPEPWPSSTARASVAAPADCGNAHVGRTER